MRMVLLRHDLPDGSSHFDWLLERGPGGDGLITFRVWDRIDGEGVRRFEAERVPDHREAYLRFEGEVSGGRGTVRRVAEGTAEVVEDGGSVDVSGNWGRGLAKWKGIERGPRWLFTVAPSGAAGG